MAGLLGDVYSYGDWLKKQVGGLLSDPAGFVGLGATRFAEDQDKLLKLQSEAYPMAGDKSVLLGKAQQQQARSDLAKQATENYGGLLGATVWHGSPHKFDAFDSGKIGTGEGAQAYGHGLYLAENPEVARQYQEKLTDPAFKYAAMNQSKVRLHQKIAARIDATDPARAASLRQSASSLSDPQGALYKVDLPDEQIAKMLDWDKPLSQQNSGVTDSLRKAIPPGYVNGRYIDPYSSARTGQSLMSELKMLADKGPAGMRTPEDAMKAQGIPGIRYLDGGSRGAGSGTSNYVVFPGNENLLQILERNGQPIK